MSTLVIPNQSTMTKFKNLTSPIYRKSLGLPPSSAGRTQKVNYESNKEELLEKKSHIFNSGGKQITLTN